MENWPGDSAPFSSPSHPPSFPFSANLSSLAAASLLSSSPSSSPYSRTCGCGLDRSCFNPTKHCNCDAQSETWQSDGGFINDE